MESDRQVPKERGEELAKKLKMLFFEISAKENINVDEAFRTLMKQVLKVRCCHYMYTKPNNCYDIIKYTLFLL